MDTTTPVNASLLEMERKAADQKGREVLQKIWGLWRSMLATYKGETVRVCGRTTNDPSDVGDCAAIMVKEVEWAVDGGSPTPGPLKPNRVNLILERGLNTVRIVIDWNDGPGSTTLQVHSRIWWNVIPKTDEQCEALEWFVDNALSAFGVEAK